MEMDTPAMFSIMKSNGALACLLYFRLTKLCKESAEAADLRLLRQVLSTKAADLKSRDDGFADLKFLALALDYINYHLCLAKRDSSSKAKLTRIIKVFPTIREMKYSI